MVDLARWLGQQLDEDASETADPYAEKAWHARNCGVHPDVWGNEGSECDCGVPARVLAEIDAKRKLLTHIVEQIENAEVWWLEGVLTPMLKHLAAPYSGRPGYAEAIASL